MQQTEWSRCGTEEKIDNTADLEKESDAQEESSVIVECEVEPMTKFNESWTRDCSSRELNEINNSYSIPFYAEHI